jgi:hypothetical protein
MKSIAGLEDLCAFIGSRAECDDYTFLDECVEEVLLLAVGLP